MAGLLDFLNTPESQLGIGLLAAAGSGASTGQGLLSAMQLVNAQKQDAIRQKYVQAQMDNMQSEMDARKLQANKTAQLQAFLAARFGQPGQTQTAAPVSTSGMAPGATPGAAIGGTGQPGVATVVPGAMPSSFPMSLNDVAALKAYGGPDLMDAYKTAMGGFKRDAGAYYVDPSTGQTKYMPKMDNGIVMGPDGTAIAMPGYAQANARIKGAETAATEGAKYPYTIGAARDAKLTDASLDMVQVPTPDGGTVMMPRSQAVAGAGGGGFGKAPGQTTLKLNENWITGSYQPTLDAGKAAGDLSASLQAIRNIDLNTGWGTEAKATAANVLSSLGVAPKNAEMFATNSQKFQSIAMERLMTMLQAQKGPQTEGDAARASKTFAMLQNTPEANQFIVDFAQAKANMDQRKAQFYEQAMPLARSEGDLTKVDREWRKVQSSIWADPILSKWAKK